MAEDGWHRVEQIDLPAEGRVRSAVIDGRSVALARCGVLSALENRCPHQGGPLGEGSIEKGWLRCPWHGYDYDPTTGKPPSVFADAVPAYDVQERSDGVYVRLPEPEAPRRTVAEVLVETLVAFGITHVFGMVGHSNLGFAEALRRSESRGVLRHRRPGLHEPPHRPLLDNHALGKISKEQLAGDYPVWQTTLHNPDWAEYARRCGAEGIRVDRTADLDDAMARLFAADGPALLCIEQDAELI